MNVIQAGGIVPGKPSRDDTDRFSARRYRHPGLPDRPVVRLVADSLGQAEDLTLEYLGFEGTEQITPVGVGRRQALGFPAWAIVNDPGNAHHALNLVKEVERLSRLARSKAGAARDGFTELAAMLDRSAPHFLPTFYEQAGRIYLDLDSPTYAATMFGKAREAEATHGLSIDEDRQREVFLEFAFAGALNVKSLSAHAKALGARTTPAEAYTQFRMLCVERTKGGLAPYTAMADDLKRLAKAAGLDVADEEAGVLRDILESESICRAPAGFWKAYRKSLAQLAKADTEFAETLVATVPDLVECHEVWLEILAESGATTVLTETGTNPGYGATWLTEVADVRSRAWTRTRSPQLLDLAGRMAERLRADGEPVALLERGSADVDLLDLCLAERIPVVEPAELVHLDVQGWMTDDQPGRRDLAALGAAEQFHEALTNGILRHLDSNQPQLAEALLEVPGLRMALRRWLDDAAKRVGDLGMAALRITLYNLGQLRHALSPQDAEWIGAIDVAGALAKTLRSGLIDEYGWPALDEAMAELLGDKPHGLGIENPVTVAGEAWPALVLYYDERLIAVGPDGVLAEHATRIPQDTRGHFYHYVRAAYVDGKFLVRWNGANNPAYWSDKPDKIFNAGNESDSWFYRRRLESSIALPGGGRFTGRRALHPGDTAVPLCAQAISDGHNYWSTTYRECYEVDPATGATGRSSLPAFFEDFSADGATLDVNVSWLHPADSRNSPLGVADGMVGWRVREEQDGSWTGQGIDGRTVRYQGQHPPVAAIRFPGSDQLVTVCWSHYDQPMLATEDNELLATLNIDKYWPELGQGSVLIPPVEWWHNMRVRDEAGSLALRAISVELAARLLAEPKSESTVAEVLPQITHPALAEAVRGAIAFATELAAKIGKIRETAARRQDIGKAAETTVTDGVLSDALTWLRDGRGYSPQPTTASPLPELFAAIPRWTAAAGPEKSVSPTPRDWPTYVAHVGALAWRAASPFATEDERTALAFLLRTVADAGIVDSGHYRVVRVQQPNQDNDHYDHVVRFLECGDGNLVLTEGQYGGHWLALQYSATPGQFALPPDWVLTSEHRPSTFGADRTTRFLDALAEHGPLVWNPGWVPDLANRTGMSTAEATLVLAGLPGVQTYRPGAKDAELRKTLGLKTADAKAAKERLKQLSHHTSFDLLEAAVPADPATLWTDGPDLAGLAEHWVGLFGKREQVPDDLVTEVNQAIVSAGVTDALTGVLNPETCSWLRVDSKITVKDDEIVIADENDGGFRTRHLAMTSQVLPWLAYHLPVGSPLRDKLSVSVAAIRDRLRNKDLLMSVGWAYAFEDVGAVLGRTDKNPTSFDVDGWLTVLSSGNAYSLFLRPAAYQPKHEKTLQALEAVAGTGETSAALDLRRVTSDELAEACAQRAPEGADPEAYFQNPEVSVPDLVAAVAEKHGLDRDSAVLYLQLLALPDPTDKRVAVWTGWKAARLKKARAVLAETDLVLTAKRARAGRTLFLPGGWLALKAPHLPLETWKAPLFGLGNDGEADGVIVPAGPVAELFRTAWQRVESGDAPAYEELNTKGRR
nr:hypothetical protein [Kibdelosporangium sp. MJ126-NF4]CEL15477.1 FIG01126201: hypothetical protein [Kibdelosporangium sp. MJ126-NF4]CTQ92121.1 FIG01126201: hypothetical protein [Kibdelosporangium sp. MJ126-NF4]